MVLCFRGLRSVTFLCKSPFKFVLFVGIHADQNAQCSGKEKIHFWGKGREGDWQKGKFMGTV